MGTTNQDKGIEAMDGWPEGVDSLIGNCSCGSDETMFECDELQTVTCLLARGDGTTRPHELVR